MRRQLTKNTYLGETNATFDSIHMASAIRMRRGACFCLYLIWSWRMINSQYFHILRLLFVSTISQRIPVPRSDNMNSVVQSNAHWKIANQQNTTLPVSHCIYTILQIIISSPLSVLTMYSKPNLHFICCYIFPSFIFEIANRIRSHNNISFILWFNIWASVRCI